MSEPKGLPINRENLDALVRWVNGQQEQARRAVEANGPRVAAAFESMARAMRGGREKS